MIPVGLARTTASYEGLVAPFDPGVPRPELAALGLAGGPAPNHVHAAVRAALFALGLDRDRFGTAAWNPLGALVAPGSHVVLKPNFIRHWNPNPEESVDSVVTHGAIVRAAADYAFRAVGREGRVTLAEAPQMDCDWEAVAAHVGLETIVARYADAGLHLEVIDLRREATRFEDGVIVERRPLPGDPAGYRVVALGRESFFEGAPLDPRRFRGADYDPAPTAEHHLDGRNDYLLSETVLGADLVVNLPKIKTHKKTGVTLSIKNLVGINGDKNWLPHHTLGGASEGGDEFPDRRLIDRLRSAATEWARPWLSRGRGLAFFRLVRRVETAARGDDFVRAGNWYGNDTTWRMCLDLNRGFYYSDAKGLHLDAERPVRRALHILDGVVAGEGNGPLAPTARPLGAVIAAADPIAADLAAVASMGFDAGRLPILREAMRERHKPVTLVERPDEVRVFETDDEATAPRERRLAALAPARPFVAHPGWRDRIELETEAAAPAEPSGSGGEPGEPKEPNERAVQ